MADDVSSRLLLAATLAEQAAAKATQGERKVILSIPTCAAEVRVDGWDLLGSPYLTDGDARLIAASGPSHWGAVAELLREVARVLLPGGRDAGTAGDD